MTLGRTDHSFDIFCVLDRSNLDTLFITDRILRTFVGQHLPPESGLCLRYIHQVELKRATAIVQVAAPPKQSHFKNRKRSQGVKKSLIPGGGELENLFDSLSWSFVQNLRIKQSELQEAPYLPGLLMLINRYSQNLHVGNLHLSVVCPHRTTEAAYSALLLGLASLRSFTWNEKFLSMAHFGAPHIYFLTECADRGVDDVTFSLNLDMSEGYANWCVPGHYEHYLDFCFSTQAPSGYRKLHINAAQVRLDKQFFSDFIERLRTASSTYALTLTVTNVEIPDVDLGEYGQLSKGRERSLDFEANDRDVEITVSRGLMTIECSEAP